MMRKILLSALAIAAAPISAHAAPLNPAPAMQTAGATVSPVETVACVRGGWRGVGVYRGCGYYRPGYRPYPYVVAPRVYVAPPVVVAGPVIPAPRQCWIAGAWRPC